MPRIKLIKALVWLLPGLVVITLGCAKQVEEPARPLLNSERIKQKFGSYGINILDANAELRVSNLYSIIV